MKNDDYIGCFAGQEIRLSLKHPDTFLYFSDYLRPAPSGPGTERAVRIPEEAVLEWAREFGVPDDGRREFELAVYSVSDALLAYDACAVHAGAILYGGRAWLFAAESGTGKSTQLKNWMSLYPGGSLVMNGDKPLLRAVEGSPVSVYPSPWKGKERWGDDRVTAPLGGVVLLRQGAENRIRRADGFHAAARLFSCFFSRFEDRNSVHKLCVIEGRILGSVPVWEMENTGDRGSTKLIHDEIAREMCHGAAEG